MSNSSDKSPTSEDIKSLFDEIETGDEREHQNVMQRLHAIRLWQLRQQEELKKQQQTQLALLKSQSNGKNDVDSFDKEEDDEILAVPISNYPEHLETLMEQSSLLDDKIQEDSSVDDDDDENSVKKQNDPILSQLKENMILENNEYVEEDIVSQDDKDNNLVNDVYYNEPKLNKNSDSENVEDLHSDIESSFEKISPKRVLFDEVPVKGGKTFEEILAQQLKDDKQKKMEKKKANASTPKRSFLRKGQGIARFNGPPKKPKLKKKTQQQHEKVQSGESNNVQPPKLNNAVTDLKVDIFCERFPPSEMTACDLKASEVKSSSNDQLQSKPCVRKTARLNRREPIKHLSLKPEVVKSPQIQTMPIRIEDKFAIVEDVAEEENHNESVWSDGEDTVLALDTSGVNGYNTTSNETFEQMEKFCNEHYADISSVKTLEGDDSVILQRINPHPPNKLMLRLFPTLRQDNKTENGRKDKNRSDDINNATTTTTTEQAKSEQTNIAKEVDVFPPPSQFISSSLESSHSHVLKNKLEEMEAEIKHFQEESAKLNNVRKEEEHKLRQLKQEFEEFHLQKEEELQRLSEFKKAEIKKLKKERKLFEDHAAASKALPNKRDREYIQELESKIIELQNESKLKEQRLSAVNGRLKSQLELAADENEKLKEKVKDLGDTVHKLEKEKESKKSKKSQAAWKAINKMVDSIPVNDENANIDDYIATHLQPAEEQIRQPAKPLPLRSPLMDRNDINNINNSDITVHDGKVEHRKKDGTTEVSFPNGTKKLVFPDGTTQIKFTNGDIKTVFPDGTVKYHYTVSGTWHTTHPNGMQVIEFSNKQIERHFPDGSKHISFEDGSSKMIKLNGSEETIFPDGTVMIVTPYGDKTIEFSNGQRETHTAEFKRREYPDGTCKTVFADGRQETKYSSGRLRIKDAHGTLIVDKMLAT